MLGEKEGKAAKIAIVPVGLTNRFALFQFSHELGAGDIPSRYPLEKASLTLLLTHDRHHRGLQCGLIQLTKVAFPVHMHR
jgi:hypothetical protein